MKSPFTSRPLILTLGILSLLALACAKSPAAVAPPEAFIPSYSFTPPTSLMGQGISVAIVNPQATEAVKGAVAMSYAKLGLAVPMTGGEDPAYRAVRDAVGRSLLQYFTSSGFTVSGPFPSVDMMTFPEKKQADLLLTVDFGVVTDQPRANIIRNDDGTIGVVSSMGN